MNLNILSAPCGIEGLEDLVHYGVVIIRVVQIVAPIALIIWCSIDLLKAVISGDDKKIRDARRPLIQRFISAIIIFVIPFLVNFVITSLVESGTDWIECYEAAK